MRRRLGNNNQQITNHTFHTSVSIFNFQFFYPQQQQKIIQKLKIQKSI